MYGLVYLYDDKRHLICVPYSINNLWVMAKDLGIKDCWFHKDHFDIPKKMMSTIGEKATRISTRDIVRIVRGKKSESKIDECDKSVGETTDS